ncbi:MAG: CoA transferase [Proteobacteria bacterium]|nr:CoA transferase [Pseudomonadota bacterium]
MTDQLTVIYAAFAAMMALCRRDTTRLWQGDHAALYECSLSLMEPYVPAYEKAELVPMRAGSGFRFRPNNLYPAASGGYVHLVASGDAVLGTRLCRREPRTRSPISHLLADQSFQVPSTGPTSCCLRRRVRKRTGLRRSIQSTANFQLMHFNPCNRSGTRPAAGRRVAPCAGAIASCIAGPGPCTFDARQCRDQILLTILQWYHSLDPAALRERRPHSQHGIGRQ